MCGSTGSRTGRFDNQGGSQTTVRSDSVSPAVGFRRPPRDCIQVTLETEGDLVGGPYSVGSSSPMIKSQRVGVYVRHPKFDRICHRRSPYTS